MSKAELKQRMRYVKAGEWDDRVLIMGDGTSYWARRVTPSANQPGMVVVLDGYTKQSVVIDPLRVESVR